MTENKFKSGDIVVPIYELIEDFKRPFWRNAKLEIAKLIYNGRGLGADIYTAKVLEISDNPYVKVGDLTDWISSHLELYTEPRSKQCNCKIETLFNQGCQCGGT
jgi:hypothetical protein